jgi:hypothetical protein
MLLAHTLSKDWYLIDRTTTEVLHIADDLIARYCRMFLQLHKTKHSPDNSRTVINLREVPLEEAVCSTLSKGLSYVTSGSHVCLPYEKYLDTVTFITVPIIHTLRHEQLGPL